MNRRTRLFRLKKTLMFSSFHRFYSDGQPPPPRGACSGSEGDSESDEQQMANYIARGASVAAGGYGGPTGSLKRTYPGQPQTQALHVINPDCELHNRQLSKSIPNFNQFIMSPQQV